MLGAVVNLAVAWSLAVYVQPLMETRGSIRVRSMPWAFTRYEGFGVELEVLRSSIHYLLSSEVPIEVPRYGALPKVRRNEFVDKAFKSVGLPIACLQASAESRLTGMPSDRWLPAGVGYQKPI